MDFILPTNAARALALTRTASLPERGRRPPRVSFSWLLVSRRHLYCPAGWLEPFLVLANPCLKRETFDSISDIFKKAEIFRRVPQTTCRYFH